MKTESMLNRILYFIYFTGIFLVLYWIFVLFFNRLIYNVVRVEWEMEWGEEASLPWTQTYYLLAPFISFMIASAISGVIQASNRAKRSLLLRIPIFIAVFWFIETIALARESSLWDFYPTNEHGLIAPAIAILCTSLIVRKMAGLRNRRFLKPQVEK